MTVPSVACNNCGKPFTTDDLRATNCRYCGTLLAHHARAQQQVAVVQQMMVDRNGNGIPDAYEGLVANAQAHAFHQTFGMNPNPYGQPMGGPMMGPAVNVQAVTTQVAQVTQTVSRIVTIVIVSVVLVILLTVGAIFFAIFLRAG